MSESVRVCGRLEGRMWKEKEGASVSRLLLSSPNLLLHLPRGFWCTVLWNAAAGVTSGRLTRTLSEVIRCTVLDSEHGGVVHGKEEFSLQ